MVAKDTLYWHIYHTGQMLQGGVKTLHTTGQSEQPEFLIYLLHFHMLRKSQ